MIPSLKHRGPTHSVIILSLVFTPVFITYGNRALPYFIAIVQHSLIGDYPTGEGIQLLWPMTTNWYGMGINMTGLTNILIEWVSFVTFSIIVLKTKDLWILFQPHPSNLFLAIPVFTVLLPSFFSFPLSVPLGLTIPHLTYLTLFTLSILIDLRSIFTTSNG